MSEARKELISHHTFMLPFKWSPREVDGFSSLEDFEKVINDYTSIPGWESDSFTLERIVDYNEFHYFYDYVREALYDYGEGKGEKPQEGFMRHLEYKPARGGKYLIETPIPPSQRHSDIEHNDGRREKKYRRTYVLEIDSVLLHLYYTGVGVLSFHLHNRDEAQAQPDDILFINQYGRRVFPPFYRIPHEKAGFPSAFSEDDFTGVGRPHGGEIAYSITLQLPNPTEEFFEEWKEAPVEMLEKNKRLTFRLAAFVSPFLGMLSKHYRIQSVLDDRMFTVCWYGNEALTKKLKPVLEVKASEQLSKLEVQELTEKEIAAARNQTDWFYKFIFVDAGQVTVQNPAMRRRLLDNAAYLRWSDYGSYYGITDYSFVLLTSELPVLRKPWNNASYLVTHVQSIYFRLCELVLVQRASVQRFSDEITHVSRLNVPQSGEPNFDNLVNKLSDDANELYKRYIRFVNRVYFREVTAQVQGIELYDKLQQQARLPQMVNGLKEEVHELHNYVRQETDRQLLEVEKGRKATEEERANFLTLLGALFLAPALLVAVYDLGFYGDCLKACPNVFYPLTIIAAVLTAVIFYQTFVVPESDKASAEELKAGNTKRRKRLPYAVGMYLLLLFSPMIYGWFHCPAPTAATVVTGDVRVIPPAASGNENIAPKEQEELKLKVPQPPTMQSLPPPVDKAKATDQKSIKE